MVIHVNIVAFLIVLSSTYKEKKNRKIIVEPKVSSFCTELKKKMTPRRVKLAESNIVL